MRSVPMLSALAVVMLAACSAEPPAAPAPVAAPAPPQVTPAPAPETVTAAYDCPTAAVVEIIREGRFARLRMTDGRIVNLGVIRGSQPPVWSEVGLRFVTTDDGAELSQDNGRTVRCTETAPPDSAPPDAS